MPEAIDALFIPFYSNVDRWHNDSDRDFEYPSLARNRGVLTALSDDLFMKDEVDLVIDGKLYDFSRFLSWVRYGATTECERYDPFSLTLLAGTYYLSYLNENGIVTRVANSVDRERLVQLGRRYDPRFILLSTTLLFDAAERESIPLAIRQIRRTWPDAIIVLGGLMLVSYEKNLPRPVFLHQLRSYGADVYVVSPRGEAPLLEILKRGSIKSLLAGPPIPCTYVVCGGDVHEPSGIPELGPEMKDAYIRWSRLPQTDHLYHTVHMRTARSCAFQCAFCEYPVNQGPLTVLPADIVDKELAEIQSTGKVRSLIFTDDTFNVPLRRFKEILKVLAKYEFEWYSFFRPQYADAETAELMKASHCRAVFAGLESVDEVVLKNMKKVAQVDQYKRGIEQLNKHGIQVHANFIVGFPGETEESAEKIVRFLDEMAIPFCTVCTWVYIPSTPIGARAHEFGIEGMGMEWKHNTMNSDQAQTLARRVVEEQRHAVHNTVRGEAWSEFMLYANGFSVDEVRLAIQTFNRYLGRDTSMEEIRSSPGYAALRAVLERRPMPKPGA
jgi:anaerobic magnesium-protoporphyrin IX monomethyl ester cyclase